MSNLIKARYVYVNGDDKKVIDSDERNEQLQMIHFNRQLIELTNASPADSEESEDSAFKEGIEATVIGNLLSEEEEKLLQHQGEQIIVDAQKQAESILENAEAEAKESSELLYEKAHTEGYEAGLQTGNLEVEQVKKELEDLIQQQKEDYIYQIEMLEPQFALVVSSLIEKITGLVVEDKKDVILYLIHNAMINADNSKSYTIRTSKEDYDFVFSRKVELSSYVNGDITMDIVMDKDLSKNQCLIETDTRIIDCSLDVQLSNLIQDIKLLSNQKE